MAKLDRVARNVTFVCRLMEASASDLSA